MKAAAKEEAKQKRAKPPPTKKRKSQKKPPPGGSSKDSELLSARGSRWVGDWHEAEFLKMELDADGDEICHLLDAKTGETHQIMFRENDLDDVWQDCLDWWPLFDCYACDVPTRGLGVCEVRYMLRAQRRICRGR